MRNQTIKKVDGFVTIGDRIVNNPLLKSRACGSKPWLTSQSAKSTTLRENV